MNFDFWVLKSFSVYWSNWYKRGIKYINDLIKESGKIYTQEEFKEMKGIKNQGWAVETTPGFNQWF